MSQNLGEYIVEENEISVSMEVLLIISKLLEKLVKLGLKLGLKKLRLCMHKYYMYMHL